MGADKHRAIVGFAAFLILPGLLMVLRDLKKHEGGAPGARGQSILDYLRDIAKDNHVGLRIVSKARALLQTREQGVDEAPRTENIGSLARTVERQVTEDQLGAAAASVGRIQDIMDGIAPSRVLTLQEKQDIIKGLHPDADERDELDGSLEDAPIGIEITEEEVRKGIEKLSPRAARGGNGWTNKLITNIMVLDGKEAALTTLTKLFNKVLDGSLDMGVMELWRTSRSALPPKNDGSGKFRPIGIGDGWYRLLGRVTSAKESPEIGNMLKPLQLAVGVASGCEIGARIAQVVYDMEPEMLGAVENAEHITLLPLDLQNAFNKMPRADILVGIRAYAPRLERMFRMLYGAPSRLILGSGELVGKSATGVRQGCPMAMIFFCLGFHATLKKISDAMIEIKDRRESRLPAGVISFADDALVFIGEKGGAEAAVRIKAIIDESRMALNVGKCRILTREGRAGKIQSDNGRDAPLFEVIDSGAKFLGNPVGTTMYRRGKIAEIVSEMQKSLPALTRVDPQSAFAILQLCINARPTYIARVGSPEDYWGVLGAFDKAVDEAVAAIAHTPLTEMSSMLRSLPVSMGGLGLRRHQGPNSERGCISSRERARAFIEEHIPEIGSGMAGWSIEEEGRRDESLFRGEVDAQDGEDGGGDDELEGVLSAEAAIRHKENKRIWLWIYRKLESENRRHHAAWLLSGSCKGTGRWLTWRGGADSRFRLSNGHFMEALRLRLLVDPFPLPGNTTCPQCQTYIRNAPFHPLDCSHTAVMRTHNHNAVRDHLFTLLQQCFPEADTIGKEMRVDGVAVVQGEGEEAGADRRGFVRADVFMRNGADVFVFDVSIVDPAAPTYLDRGSDRSPDVAAKYREGVKTARFVKEGVDTVAQCVPFVVESTGRLGPAALAFFKRHIEENHRAKGWEFMSKISASIARWNSRMVEEMRIYIHRGGAGGGGGGNGGGDGRAGGRGSGGGGRGDGRRGVDDGVNDNDEGREGSPGGAGRGRGGGGGGR